MISKTKQELARKLNMSDKTFLQWEKYTNNMYEFFNNIGTELSTKFETSYNLIHNNKKIMISNKEMWKVVTLPPDKQIEIAKEFIENPNNMRNIWKKYFSVNTKITIEMNKRTNELLEKQAKEKGLSKKTYASNILMLILRVIDGNKE